MPNNGSRGGGDGARLEPESVLSREASRPPDEHRSMQEGPGQEGRLLFEQVPVGVFRYDRELVIRDCNEAMCAMLEVPRELMLGLQLERLRDQRPIGAIRRALAGEDGRYEGPYRSTIAGVEIFTEVRAAPFHGNTGEIVGGIAIVRDVTEQVRGDLVHRALWQISEAAHRVGSLQDLQRSVARVLSSLAPGTSLAILDRDDPDCDPSTPKLALVLLDRVARAGRGISLAATELADLARAEGLAEAGLERWSGIPLLEAEAVTGAVGLGWSGPTGLFDHRGVLDLLAGQIALAVERKRHEARLEVLARQDELTGLPNRRGLREVVRRELLEGRHGLLLFTDLDRFKRINDTLGHDAGDELLRLVAQVVSEVAGEAGGFCARLGGDEFAVLAPGAGREAAPSVVAALRSALDRVFLVRGHRVRVSASVGVALAPEHGRSLEELLRCADIALYAARDAGAAFAVFDPAESGLGERRLELETRLREAIASDGLRLVFQPLYGLTDGRRVGAEALVRWPLGGRLLSAGEFVPVAEESDLIERLDLWVLEQVMVCLASRPSFAGHLAVNLSARTLHDPALVGHIATRLAAHDSAQDGSTDLVARRLIVEVTETAAVRRPGSLRLVLQQLRDLGVRIAIDDFGSGFASLTSLRALPCDILKIDRTLVAEIGVHEGAEPILTAALALGRGLGLETVAEGIETEAQAEWLRAAGCDFGQGWYLGKPRSWAELTEE